MEKKEEIFSIKEWDMKDMRMLLGRLHHLMEYSKFDDCICVATSIQLVMDMTIDFSDENFSQMLKNMREIRQIMKSKKKGIDGT